MAEYIRRETAIAYIREQSEECQKAFEELGGESGIYADAYNDLAEDFYSIPAADVAPVVRCMDCKHLVSVNVNGKGIPTCRVSGMEVAPDEFCSRGEKGRR
jgi:hypothetical protein